jgi:hypothetical protein
MQNRPPSSFCAGAAIAAVLALGSTGALAQEAAPAPDMPDISAPNISAAAAPTPPAPAPQIVTQSNPVVQTVPVAEPAADTAAPAASRAANRAQPVTRQAQPVRSAARSAQAVAAVPVAAPITPPPAVITPVAPVVQAPLAAPQPVAPAVSRPAISNNELTGAETGLLALLAAAGLGGAFIVARSRRRRSDDLAVDEAAVPGSDLFADPAPRPAAQAVPRAATVAVAASPERRPEHLAMPADPVSSGAGRDALLQRMVAAPPDTANPFVSRKRRVRRARMLLAQREGQVRSQASESFDWRTYRPSDTAAPVRQAEPSVG